MSGLCSVQFLWMNTGFMYLFLLKKLNSLINIFRFGWSKNLPDNNSTAASTQNKRQDMDDCAKQEHKQWITSKHELVRQVADSVFLNCCPWQCLAVKRRNSFNPVLTLKTSWTNLRELRLAPLWKKWLRSTDLTRRGESHEANCCMEKPFCFMITQLTWMRRVFFYANF